MYESKTPIANDTIVSSCSLFCFECRFSTTLLQGGGAGAGAGDGADERQGETPPRVRGGPSAIPACCFNSS
jgi:hypothetical protein